MSPNVPVLREVLERHYQAFDYGRYRERDPIRFLEPYRGGDLRALEVVGFVGSALAYGQVDIVLRSVADALDRMDADPVAYVQAVADRPGRHLRDWKGFRHRFNSGRDMLYLLHAIGRIQGRFGSLEAAAPREGADIAGALTALVDTLASTDPRPVFGARTREVPQATRFLFPSPRDGSTCKRLLLFARWMVRGDPAGSPTLDFGVWTRHSPASLLLPLDTHTSRIVRYLGLVRRNRTLGLKMAQEATAALKLLDPADPVKYDFALAHLGISRQCRHRRVPEICGGCALDPVCQLEA
jgi:uncharacterized protein (TIGR02757 family)